MTAATVTKYVETGLPTVEVVQLTVTDGETYNSRKFSRIEGAQVSGAANVDAHINVTWSGKVATINYASQTDKLVTLTLYGSSG